MLYLVMKRSDSPPRTPQHHSSFPWNLRDSDQCRCSVQCPPWQWSDMRSRDANLGPDIGRCKIVNVTIYPRFPAPRRSPQQSFLQRKCLTLFSNNFSLTWSLTFRARVQNSQYLFAKYVKFEQIHVLFGRKYNRRGHVKLHKNQILSFSSHQLVKFYTEQNNNVDLISVVVITKTFLHLESSELNE